MFVTWPSRDLDHALGSARPTPDPDPEYLPRDWRERMSVFKKPLQRAAVTAVASVVLLASGYAAPDTGPETQIAAAKRHQERQMTRSAVPGNPAAHTPAGRASGPRIAAEVARQDVGLEAALHNSRPDTALWRGGCEEFGCGTNNSAVVAGAVIVRPPPLRPARRYQALQPARE